MALTIDAVRPPADSVAAKATGNTLPDSSAASSAPAVSQTEPAAGDTVAGDTTAGTSPPLDDTAETAPDTAATASEELVRRAEILMLQQRVEDQDREARLDRMRSDFDFAQQMRTEFLREMNILRDMAMEQRKKDDELIKKWIALI